MPRILLDQGVPRGVRSFLQSHEVRSAYEMGWERLTNGHLIVAAESAGFDVMITCDQNIIYQQNLSDRTIALIVLETNHWPTIRRRPEVIQNAVDRIVGGSCVTLPFGPPDRRR